MFFQKQDSILIGKFPLFVQDESIVHGMSTRKDGVSSDPFHSLNLGLELDDPLENVLTNRNRFLSAFSYDEKDIVQANQIHSDRIKIVSTPGTYDGFDGFLTHIPDLPLTIRVADCMPVFLYDPLQKIIGLIHAGWKGTQLKIIPKAVQLMRSHFRSKSIDIKAALGPAIGSCCYEIQGDVASQFPNQYVRDNHLVIGQYNYDQLVETGLSPENIERSDLCTCCHQEWFFSHRGSGGKTGRMLALLSLKSG